MNCLKIGVFVYILIQVSLNEAEGRILQSSLVQKCSENQKGTYRAALQFCDGKYWRSEKGNCSPQIGTSCLDIKKKGLSRGDGEYLIDPDGDGAGKPFYVYCDMSSFGGGWTMCYTTDSHVNIKTELVTTPALGYRADCNNIPFTEVIFVDEKSKQKAAFKKSGSPVTFTGNYDKQANAYGLWTAQGVATTQYKYQMLICDASFYKGLHVSGFTKNCYKRCHQWCSDSTSAYFRTSAVSDKGYKGVAFNQNGHKPLPNRLISAGIR
ncbi:uncharacterized protein LOC114535549 [Dendronephthya gigantea]|uniref:uncharacterized protein LOC114535549 n=2 Tax=Dendronephthya gigantea TaxID=151771 RepID=UPI0010690F27|nr:uncharacterized protein LOC114535549 [Dendronephthya gigantea]XP_028412650.1 uncharacterized protein LOC114535549 [Dendronephthya gigantea]XP_028412651.1 uncharacterized protein LOC114535549 [Dendronephthya gigantea]XP_028412652.1 uncharacterized protein LOC114535549 [Dendronephthya gigantea]